CEGREHTRKLAHTAGRIAHPPTFTDEHHGEEYQHRDSSDVHRYLEDGHEGRVQKEEETGYAEEAESEPDGTVDYLPCLEGSYRAAYGDHEHRVEGHVAEVNHA